MSDVRTHASIAVLPDLFHLHEPSWLGGFAVEIGRLGHVPVLCQESTFPTLQPPGYDVPKRKHLDYLKREAWFIAMLPYMATDMLIKGISPNHIFSLPSGIAIPDGVAQVEKSKNVLYVGNFSQSALWKAFDVLLEAWGHVHRDRPDATLTIVGGGDALPWINLARQTGVDSSIVFTGRVPNTEPFFRKAGLFVLPSRVEGMSNALLEAMSWGLPCVVSDIPGNRSVIDNELNGLVVQVNNPLALAKAIIQVLNNPSLRLSMGANARKKAESEYDLGRVTDRLIEIYRGILVEHHKGLKE